MIALLSGRLVTAREFDRGCEVVVEAGGIGYQVAVTPEALGRMPARGADITLHTHLHVREDDLSLYGFETDEERDLFETLIAASGIGPRVGLAILAVHSPQALRKAVASEDADALTLVSGIGAKTAQKLLLELKDRLGMPALEVVANSDEAALADVRAALAGLGYGPAEMRAATDELDPDGEPEELLREALRRLGDRAREA